MRTESVPDDTEKSEAVWFRSYSKEVSIDDELSAALPRLTYNLQSVNK